MRRLMRKAGYYACSSQAPSWMQWPTLPEISTGPPHQPNEDDMSNTKPAMPNTETHLDAILRASGSALRHYAMAKTQADMRLALLAYGNAAYAAGQADAAPQVDAGEQFNAAINFAITRGTGAADFLRAWREGDTDEWPEFAEAALKGQAQ